ncbi:MAG: extracellular solute-binding protein [Anaerotruncus sp.]|nr:extracellular solute-binding protein [Anaerotruncus sp.]
MKQWKRLFALATAGLLLLAGCNGDKSAIGIIGGADGPTAIFVTESDKSAAPEAQPSGEEKVLNLFTWVDYFPDDILEEFSAQTGMKINYSTFESNEEMLMKVQSGGEYDLVLASDYIIEIARQQDQLLPLDKEKIPNFKNINPAFQSKFFDPENQYTVPYAAGIPLIIYNPQMVDFEVTGYEDLWNPAFKDSVVVMDDARNVIGLTLKTLGKGLNETDPAVLAQAQEKLQTLWPNIRALDYNTPYNLMISGETAIGYMFTSQVITALNENPELKVVFPKEGLGFGIDACFVPAKAPHPENAMAFLDFILEGERSAHITDQIYYISCNSAATEYLSNQALVIPDEAIKGAEFIQDVGEATQLYNDIWTQFKQG